MWGHLELDTLVGHTAGGVWLVGLRIRIPSCADLGVRVCAQFPVNNDARGGARWVDDQREIVKNYLLGWFAIDFLSIFVSGLDIVNYAIDGDGSADTSTFRILRVLRALRLMKLVRLMRASRMFRRWETRIEINYGMLILKGWCVAILLCSHWFACIWSLREDLAART